MLREVVVSPVPLVAMLGDEFDPDDPKLVEGDETGTLKCCDHVSLHAKQDRVGCCGTMQLPEYLLGDSKKLRSGRLITDDELLAPEIKKLAEAFK